MRDIDKTDKTDRIGYYRQTCIIRSSPSGFSGCCLFIFSGGFLEKLAHNNNNTQVLCCSFWGRGRSLGPPNRLGFNSRPDSLQTSWLLWCWVVVGQAWRWVFSYISLKQKKNKFIPFCQSEKKRSYCISFILKIKENFLHLAGNVSHCSRWWLGRRVVVIETSVCVCALSLSRLYGRCTYSSLTTPLFFILLKKTSQLVKRKKKERRRSSYRFRASFFLFDPNEKERKKGFSFILLVFISPSL